MLEPLPRHGPRVTLRRLSIDDLPRFQSYRGDRELGRYQGWLPQSDAEALAFLGRMRSTALFAPGEWVQLGIADRATDELLGDVGLHLSPDGSEAEIGFTLHPGAHGRGLGTEAVAGAIALLFEHTSIHRVIGITDARNLPSIRLLERLGMRRSLTRAALFRGAPCVEHTYEVVRGAGD